MRKFLTFLLALIMILSLAACGTSGDDTTDKAETDPVETDAPSTDDTSETDAPTDTNETDAPTDTDDTAETDAPSATEFKEVNETVYVYGTDVLNVRKEPSRDSERMGEMKEGEQVTRTGYNESWSRISFYGNIYYASSDYLTTRAPLEFSDKTDTVFITAEGTLNLRKKPSSNADIVAFLPYGTELSRTGIATTADDNGITWSRLLHNGEVCYASTSFLSTEKPSLSDTDEDFAPCNETVYVARQNGSVKILSLNVRALPSLTGNSIAVLEPDTMLTRVGIAKKADSDGIVWSKVIVNGKTGYVSSNYVTAEKPAEETTNTEN